MMEALKSQIIERFERLSDYADRTVTSRAENAPVPASAERLYCEVAMKRLQEQAELVRTFDTKATTLLTIGSTILPITASLLINGQGARGVLTTHQFSAAALVAAAGSYVVLIIGFFMVFNFGDWDTRPELKQWQHITPGQSEEAMFRWLGDAYVEAYERNSGDFVKKARLAGVVATALAFEAMALTVAVLIPIIF